MVLGKKIVFVVFLLSIASFSFAQDQLIENQSETYVKTITPLICVESAGSVQIFITRELLVYSANKTVNNRTVSTYYSTIKLTAENPSNVSLINLTIKEHIPDEVAVLPSEIMFGATPVKIEKGSVVVTWVFDNLDPNEKKSVNYTVEKKLEKGVLERYEAPKVIAEAQAVKKGGGAGASPGATVSPQGGGFDLFYLIPVAIIIIALIFLYVKVIKPAQG
jgi:hypothetical protein